VDINLHEMMVFNRREAIKNGHTDEDVKRFIKAYKFVTASRRRMNLGPTGIKNMLLKNHIGNYWGGGRAMPKVAPKNFSQLFAEKHRS
jgi:L-lactate dehydrogenase complex protein LldF